MKRLYLDHAATSPLLDSVHDAMARTAVEGWGNPSSLHAEGRRAKQWIDVARERVSGAFGVGFGSVVFTSGGTEAAELALLGTLLANTNPSRNRVLMNAVEHRCVLAQSDWLSRLGVRTEVVRVGKDGRIDLNHLEELLDGDVLLVACMHVNNETGAVQPVHEVSRLCRDRDAIFFCDAVQSFPEAKLDDLGVDLASCSAHKIGGPPGVGALAYGSRARLQPVALGGPQERGLRAGTENLPGIVGLGEAVVAYRAGCRPADAFLNRLQELLGEGVERVLPLETPQSGRHAQVRFVGRVAETTLILLDRAGISASGGSACSSGSFEPSHVLTAMGWDTARAREAVRFSFSPTMTESEARHAAERVAEVVGKGLRFTLS